MVSKFLHPHNPVGYFSLIIEFTIKNWLTKEMVPRKTPTDMSFSLCFMFFILTVKIVFMFMSIFFFKQKTQ
jgi:hypothetical protein